MTEIGDVGAVTVTEVVGHLTVELNVGGTATSPHASLRAMGDPAPHATPRRAQNSARKRYAETGSLAGSRTNSAPRQSS